MKKLLTLLTISFILLGLSADEKTTVKSYEMSKKALQEKYRNAIKADFKPKIDAINKMDESLLFETGKDIELRMATGSKRKVAGILEKISDKRIYVSGRAYLVKDFSKDIQRRLAFSRNPKLLGTYKESQLDGLNRQINVAIESSVERELANKGYDSNVLNNSMVINGQYWTMRELGISSLTLHALVSKTRAKLVLKSNGPMKTITTIAIKDKGVYVTSKEEAVFEKLIFDLKRETLTKDAQTTLEKNLVIRQVNSGRIKYYWELSPKLVNTVQRKGYVEYVFKFMPSDSRGNLVEKNNNVPPQMELDIIAAEKYQKEVTAELAVLDKALKERLAREEELRKAKEALAAKKAAEEAAKKAAEEAEKKKAPAEDEKKAPAEDAKKGAAEEAKKGAPAKKGE